MKQTNKQTKNPQLSSNTIMLSRGIVLILLVAVFIVQNVQGKKLADKCYSCFQNMKQMDLTNIGQQLHSGVCFECKGDKCELRN